MNKNSNTDETSGDTPYKPIYIPDYSNRIEYYVEGRPNYPKDVVALLNTVGDIKPGSKIADIGAGTGIFSEMLLNYGYRVDAIEPNKSMFLEAKKRCSQYSNFRAYQAQAEYLPLLDSSIDSIAVAQALHWFNTNDTVPEFRRISRKQAKLLCVWNERNNTGSPFMVDLERLLLDLIPNYRLILSTELDPVLLTKPYSANNKVDLFNFEHTHILDRSGFIACILSKSFSPAYKSFEYEELYKYLNILFDRYSNKNLIELKYCTVVTVCKLHGD